MGRGASSSKRARRPAPPPTSKFTARLRSSSGVEQSKKVKFADLDVGAKDIPSNHKSQNVATNSTKTSEFSYFKKIWGNSHHKEIAQTSNIVAPKSDKRGVPIQVPIEKQNSISPPESFINHKFDEKLNEEATCSGINDTPIQDLNANNTPFHVYKITPLNQRPLLFSPEGSRSSDKRYENGGVFVEKRRKLIKLATKTLGVGIDEFSSRRSELIDKLLLRLGIKPQSDLQGSISSSYKDAPCNKTWLQNSNFNANNHPTLPSIEYINNPTDYTLPSLPFRDLVPHNYSFRGQVREQSHSLVPYGSTSYSNLHGFQSPIKQFSPDLDTKSNLSLDFYDSSSDFCDENRNFNDCINNKGVFLNSPIRKQNYALEWKNSPICEKESYSSHISNVNFVNEDPINEVFDGKIRELGSRFSYDGFGSSWHSHQGDGFDFDFFE